jgi:hypothetical protein
MNANADNTVPPPFNRFLILLPGHQNGVNMDHSAQNSDCDTGAYASVTPMPYDLRSSNAYQNNNWNNSWSNNWNNMGSENCYTYKCIYSLDDFADHKHSLTDSNEPCKDGSNSESNSESCSENDSSGSKSAHDGSNNNSYSNRCSSQLASWNYDQSHNGTTAGSADSDSTIDPLTDRYSTQNQRSSLREVPRESTRDDVSVTVQPNNCTGATYIIEEAFEHHEYNSRAADSSGSRARKSAEHELQQDQEEEKEVHDKDKVKVKDKDNTNFITASLPLSLSRGDLPLIPPCPPCLPSGAHESMSHCSITVTAVKEDYISGIDAAAEVSRHRHANMSVEEVEALRDREDSIEEREVVTGDAASEGDRRGLGRGEGLEAFPSGEVAGRIHVSATDPSRCSSKSDTGRVKEERAKSGSLHDLKRPEPGSALNLLPRQMLVRRSSAPKLTSSTPLSSTSSSSSSQRKGNAKVRQLKLQGIQHGKDFKKSHIPQQQQQQHRVLSMESSTASSLAATIPGTHVRRPFSSLEHSDVINMQDRGSSTVTHPPSSIVSCHDAANQSAFSPITSIQTKSDAENLVVLKVCVTCTHTLPQEQRDSADVATSEFTPKDNGKVINCSNDSKQGRQDKAEKAAASAGYGCGSTPAVTSDALLALATPRSPPNTVIYPHSSPHTARVSTPSSKSHSPGVSCPSTPGALTHPLHSQHPSPSTPIALSDSSKVLISSPRFPKGESPHSPLCGSRTVMQMHSPNADCQGEGRYMKDLLLMSLRCLRSESERALLLNQQAVQSAVIVGLQHRMFPLPIPLPLPTQNLPSRPHLPFPKPLNNEFPSKHTSFTAHHLSDDPRHGFNLKRHHTFDSRTERELFTSFLI